MAAPPILGLLGSLDFTRTHCILRVAHRESPSFILADQAAMASSASPWCELRLAAAPPPRVRSRTGRGGRAFLIDALGAQRQNERNVRSRSGMLPCVYSVRAVTAKSKWRRGRFRTQRAPPAAAPAAPSTPP